MTSATVPVPKISSTRLNSKRPTRPQLMAPTTTSASHTGSMRLMTSIASSCSRATDLRVTALDVRFTGPVVTRAALCKGSCSYAPRAVDPFALREPGRPRARRDEPAADPDAVELDAELHPEAGGGPPPPP